MVNLNSDLPYGTIHDQASSWFVLLQSDNATKADHKMFKHWLLTSADHREAYDRVSLTMESFDGLCDDSDIIALRAAALQSPARKKRWVYIGSIAASIAIFIFFIAGLNSGDWTMLLPSGTDHNNITGSANILETAVGERSTVTLSDGSIINLNTDTRMRKDLTPERRLIVLTRGQAIFEVAKDSERPFVVLAGDQRITAVGTQFEVRTDAKGTAVTLLEGKVLIDPVRIDAVVETTQPPVPSVELVPGDRFVASTNAEPVIEKANIAKATSWRDGRVDFEDEPLLDVVHEINRYSTHKVILDDPSLMELRVSGSFRTGSVDNFLSALTAVYPVTVNRQNSQSILQWKKDS